MGRPLRSRLALAHGHVRWAFGIVRSTSPRLFLAQVLIAALLTGFPAGIALSVRGLVNSVSAALSGVPLDQTAAYPWLLFGFAMTLGASTSSTLSRWLLRRIELELRSRLHGEILQHSLAMPFDRIEQRAYQDAFHRARSSPEGHVASLYSATLELGTRSLQALSLLLILLAIEPLLLVLLLPVGIPYLLFQWRLSRRQFEELDARLEKERWMGYYSGLPSNLDQVAEIKLLGLGSEIIARWKRIMEEFRGLRIGFLGFELVGTLLFVLFSVAAIYLAMAKAVGAIVDGHLTIGDLAIFGSASAQLRSLIEQSVALVAGIRWKLLYVGRLRGFLAARPEPVTLGGASTGEIRGRVELRDLVFRYPGATEPTLRGLSFTIEPGETVALVGANGAGKTTVARLIAGLYPIQQGAILVDGRDVRELDPEQLRRHIGCVFQQFGRYMASAADNIAFGDWQRLGGDRAAIEAIARSAEVDALVRSMPNGYETLLGRQFGDYQPSGGQWQQLAIARLIARDARILILDEPTANLDVAAEAALFEQFRSLAAGRTTLLISHRFSTVSMADRILVMDAGQIVESGSHPQLVARDGRYAALFALSQRSAAEAGAQQGCGG